MCMLLLILMRICADLFIVCVYVLPLKNQLSKEEGWIPLTGLTLPHICSCPNPGTGFPSSYVMVFWCSGSLFQITVIACFVGIIYHHCLKVVVCFGDIGVNWWPSLFRGVCSLWWYSWNWWPSLFWEMIVCFVDIGVNYRPSLFRDYCSLCWYWRELLTITV
jgi:hypothetical protein